MTSWFVPFTGGDNVSLPRGVEFVIASDHNPDAVAVYCDIVDYDKWESFLCRGKCKA